MSRKGTTPGDNAPKWHVQKSLGFVMPKFRSLLCQIQSNLELKPGCSLVQGPDPGPTVYSIHLLHVNAALQILLTHLTISNVKANTSTPSYFCLKLLKI